MTRPTTVLEDAVRMAVDAGYTGDAEKPDTLTAPLGRFESEPFYLPYYFDHAMNGCGETIYQGDTAGADIFNVSDEEREAFTLDASTVAVAVTYSESGFLGIVELTDAELTQLRASDVDANDDDTAGMSDAEFNGGAT